MNHESMNHENICESSSKVLLQAVVEQLDWTETGSMHHESMNHESMNHESMKYESMNHESMNHESMKNHYSIRESSSKVLQAVQ